MELFKPGHLFRSPWETSLVSWQTIMIMAAILVTSQATTLPLPMSFQCLRTTLVSSTRLITTLFNSSKDWPQTLQKLRKASLTRLTCFTAIRTKILTRRKILTTTILQQLRTRLLLKTKKTLLRKSIFCSLQVWNPSYHKMRAQLSLYAKKLILKHASTNIEQKSAPTLRSCLASYLLDLNSLRT